MRNICKRKSKGRGKGLIKNSGRSAPPASGVILSEKTAGKPPSAEFGVDEVVVGLVALHIALEGALHGEVGADVGVAVGVLRVFEDELQPLLAAGGCILYYAEIKSFLILVLFFK